MKAIKARRLWIGHDDKDCIVAVGRSRGEVLSQGHVWRVAREAVLPTDRESVERMVEQVINALCAHPRCIGVELTPQTKTSIGRAVLRSLGLAGRGKP